MENSISTILSRLRESLRERATTRDVLNPLLFDDSGKLKPLIKDKLLAIVDTFLDYIEIETKIYDARLVGSNAAYNYTDQSDIDVHIIVNLSSISTPESIARLYLDSVKKNFKDTYDITIKGHEVELYVEDINTTSISNGVYSLYEDEWIKSPEVSEEAPPDVLNQVENLKDEYASSIDDIEDLESLQDIEDELYLLRRDSLASDGEYGLGNLVFKELRNEGYLDTLKDKIHELQSDELSLESKEY